jgi:hypothetical protein
MFQRLKTAANGLFENTAEVFKYELSSVPSSVFDCNHQEHTEIPQHLFHVYNRFHMPILHQLNLTCMPLEEVRCNQTYYALQNQKRKELFMSNSHNKQALINMLCEG